MAHIVIQGGEAEAAARAMCLAVREIFCVDPVLTAAGAPIPGGRSLELLTLLVTLPITSAAAADLVSRAVSSERWRRLTARAESEATATRARLLIDVGDGKPIPLHEANREKIEEALAEFEKNIKR